MRVPLIAMLGLCILSCDPNRVYEQNQRIEGKYWYVDSVMVFDFEIAETNVPYHLFLNVSCVSGYTHYNLYYRYSLLDSTGETITSDLISEDLFDPKTGEPLGSGLGDQFDHRFMVLENYQFINPGGYSLAFQQYMRTDSLPGIISIGARVEKATPGGESGE